MAGIKDYSTTPGSNTSVNAISIAEGCAAGNVNNAMRQIMADIRELFESGGWINWGDTHTYASTTSTTVSGDVTTRYHAGRAIRAVGSATGTIYGKVASSSYSAPNTTINYTWDSGTLSNEALTVSIGLIQVTGKTLDSTAVRGALSTADIGVTVLAPSGSGSSLTGIRKQGLETIWIPAGAMVARTTNGAASGTAESTTNKVMYKSLDFDTATQEFAQFTIRFPKSWNEGTVTFAPVWTAASGSGGVVFGLAGVALSDDDAIDTAYGTAQTSTDTLITASDVHVGPTSSAITIAGTPAVGDWVSFQINRTVSDGSDTLGVDARLLGVVMFFTTDAGDDT